MSELVTLTKTEVQTLADLEAIVERGQLTFIEVGKALFRIKNEELFAQTHGSFTEYCKDKWGWNIQYANKLIKSAQIVERFDPIGSSPTSEGQIRPLTKLATPDEQYEAWTTAHEIAEDENVPVTGKLVERVVSSMKEKEEKSEQRKHNTELNKMAERASHNSCAGRAIACLKDIDLKSEGAAAAFNQVIDYCRTKLLEIEND